MCSECLIPCCRTKPLRVNDSFILGVHPPDQDHKTIYKFWDGKDLVKLLEASLKTCCLAPGMLSSSLGIVYKDSRPSFRLSWSEGDFLCILDSDTYLFCTYGKDGVFNVVFNPGDEIISAWKDFDSYSLDGNDFAAYYLSQKDRFKVILFYDDCLLVLDISEPETVDITTLTDTCRKRVILNSPTMTRLQETLYFIGLYAVVTIITVFIVFLLSQTNLLSWLLVPVTPFSTTTCSMGLIYMKSLLIKITNSNWFLRQLYHL